MKKRQTTIFNNKANRNMTNINYKTQPLENVKSYKYLGVDICEDLNMDTYVNSVYNTAPNTMICCTVYTKRVRKNNTSTYTNLSLKHCIVKCALYQHYAVFEY